MEHVFGPVTTRALIHICGHHNTHATISPVTTGCLYGSPNTESNPCNERPSGNAHNHKTFQAPKESPQFEIAPLNEWSQPIPQTVNQTREKSLNSPPEVVKTMEPRLARSPVRCRHQVDSDSKGGTQMATRLSFDCILISCSCP
jgi:hypothetical protein